MGEEDRWSLILEEGFAYTATCISAFDTTLLGLASTCGSNG